MNQTISLRILEILTSKTCHDLISPIGAVNNGVEFMEDIGAGEDASDAVDLIAHSAQQASAKLQAFRIAYGAGGADSGIKPEDVHAIIENLITLDGKIKQDWEPDPLIGLSETTGERPSGFGKILVCAFMLAIDALPKGGTLSLDALSQTSLEITASGVDAGLREGYESALMLSIAEKDLEPKFIHAYITGLFCKQYGFEISVNDAHSDKVVISITLPAA